jgi:hypothetical protein
LPDQSDNPEHPSTLPRPNLNPLLNPVLAKNIGRWAEVYFTNPPEKRERAVQELVRELERGSPIRRDSVAPQLSPRQRDLESDKPVASMTAEVPAQGVTCRSCGYVNRPKHKFCGRCGMRIASPTVGILEEQEPRTDFPISIQSSENPEAPIFGFESAPRWQSYRLLAGVALALVVVILGYMAWHSSETTSGASHVASPAPPFAVTNPVAPVPQPATPKTEPQPATPKADTTSQTPSAPAKPERLPEDSLPKTRATAPPAAPAKTNPVGANPPPIPASTSGGNGAGTWALTGSGADELAIARNILNGTQQSRSQAVPWLWKAVAKQNVEATVLLSGLYLRGDGVPKNCEQARLLLDAAALKKRKDAAELLRNLRAFGCE